MAAPWSLAHQAASAAGVELRPCATVADSRRIKAVMAATWGDLQVLTVEQIRALAESGNVPYGAFAGDDLAGFVLGWAGVDTDGLHVHSHMLAAAPDRRHAGVGYALKLAQRAQALDLGIRTIKWTFDPLVARNAYFNLHKLGATVDRFERDFYGEMGDEINRGDRSDRFTARWDLGREPGPRDITELVERIEIPPEYHELRARDPEAGQAWRDDVAARAERCLGSSLVAAGFDRDASAYLFVHPEAL